MKKYLLLIIPAFFILSACQKSNSEINNILVKNVTEAEFMVNKHDSVIQIMLENGLHDSIPSMTQNAVSFLGQKLTNIHALEVPDVASNYKSAAALYIESLIRIVKAEDLYSNYNDSITEQEAATLDNFNIEAAKSAEFQHSKYMEYQRAFTKANGL